MTDEEKASRNEYQRNLRKQEHIKAKKYHMKYNYGISPEEYDNMFSLQNNCCAICGEEKKLYVDHNHTTGKIRELLCGRCNIIVGAIEDWRFSKAKDYVDRHEDVE